ncbi:MORC family CW-type zinc finger protein 4 isoform X2 [Larus michahellis]|uniref:MORC family CW-type zinc finger protein 4 isoform X2 n=1 Tax=Larus michahellis TaxID=119627 RepID=UPI003D9AF83C
MKITFGFTCKSKSHYRIVMCHNNRLIGSYEKLGCQRERPDQTWVQCEEYLKWRKLPDQVDPTIVTRKLLLSSPSPPQIQKPFGT